MRPIKVKYISLGDNPDKLDILVREYDTVDKTTDFNRCPVYRHRKTRTFVGYSPIDFKIGFENGKMWVSDFDLISANHMNETSIVYQLNICNFAFWTDEPDVWIDYSCHPLTSLNNNFTVIEGWFNLSNWSRNTSLTVNIVDKTKPVIIKKGDPLFRIKFLSPDLNRGVVLEKKSELLSKLEYHLSKPKDKNFEKGNKLFSKTKKCPFRFLFK